MPHMAIIEFTVQLFTFANFHCKLNHNQVQNKTILLANNLTALRLLRRIHINI